MTHAHEPASSVPRPPEDPVADALAGAHHGYALGGRGPARRYRPSISPFATLGGPDLAGPDWAGLSDLDGDACGVFAGPGFMAGPGWQLVQELTLWQLSGAGIGVVAEIDGVEPLSREDVPEMLDLTARTQPGPFLEDTIALGGYVGIRRGGRLVAMAGRRLAPPGWIEVSAVCTDPAYRGQGLARRVTGAVIAGIRAEGAEPFLHVMPDNPARHLYAAMGFRLAREAVIAVLARTASDPARSSAAAG